MLDVKKLFLCIGLFTCIRVILFDQLDIIKYRYSVQIYACSTSKYAFLISELVEFSETPRILYKFFPDIE